MGKTIEVSDHNIYREAHRLLATKSGRDMTQDELELVATAIIPAMVLPQYSDVPLGDCLEAIAKLVEEARQD